MWNWLDRYGVFAIWCIAFFGALAIAIYVSFILPLIGGK